MRAALLVAGALAWPLRLVAADHPLPPPPPASTDTVRLDYVAEHMDYDETKSEIHLKGGVKVRESTWTIKASELWLDTRERVGRSSGYILVEDGTSALYGDSGEFDFERHTGLLHHASAGAGDWRIHARSAALLPGRKLDYYGADFTSCNVYPDPHYHFHSSSLSVVPKKRLVAWNTLFYLGPVPLFYTPFLYKSLAPEPFLRFRVQPGYDHRNGAFAKGTLLTDLGPHLYSKLYLDYYGAQGLGTGEELQRRSGDSRGVLYGYRIREQRSGRDRWTVLGNGYESLLSSSAARGALAAQARLQLQSDADFNNDYARASTFRVTPELINNAAVVYRSRLATTRLSYSRLDEASSDHLRYIRATESTPRLDVQTTQLRLWRLPWLNTFDGFADNSFDQTRPFIQKSAGAGWEGTRTLPLARGWSLTPKAAYHQAYFNRFDEPGDFASTATVKDAFVGRYLASGTLRWSNPLGDWDLTHAYTRRQKPDSMADDAGAPDHGVEQNLTTLVDGFRPTRQVYVRAFSGYDFRVFRDREVGFRDRVQPIVGEINYAPRSTLSFSVRDDYQLAQGNRSFLFNALWGEELGTFLGGGAGYNRSSADQYFLNAEFGFSPSSGSWRATAALRSEAETPGGPGRLSGFRLFEKEFMISKNWHDFYTKVQLRFRPGGVKEATVRVELRLGRTGQDKLPKRDWESEWFPERRLGTDARP